MLSRPTQSLSIDSLSSKQNLRSLSCVLLALFFVMTSTSCGWVDSTGSSNNDGNNDDKTAVISSEPATTGSFSPGSTANTAVNLADTRIVQVFEQNTIRVTPAIGDASTASYEWRLTASGMGDAVCQRVGVFDSNLAVDTLQQACTDQNGCELNFMQSIAANGQSVFDVVVPQLRAPVSLGFELFATQQNGITATEDFTICAVSVNDPPTADNDIFSVVRGQTLSVNGSDIINLLSNDSDDEDIANRSLSVLTDSFVEPTLTNNFQLRADGGFTYTAPASLAANTTDRFTYQITDGNATSRATVTIRVIASNRPPALVADVPDLTLIAGQVLSIDDSTLDLSAFFTDPDSDSLVFAVAQSSLPPSNNLSISSEGRVVGRVTDEDIGNYTVELGVTDTNAIAITTFTLAVLPKTTLVNNAPPTIEPVDSVVVAAGERVTIQVSATDPDGDRLQFMLNNDSPDFISINRNNGRITIAAEEPGLFRATVVVSDGENESTTLFFIRVASENNQPPQVDDISNLVVSGPFNYDVAVFFEDPDGDTMTYSAINLPPGLSISPSGVISGSPAPNNLGPHFVVVTADDGNLGMASDGFLLRIIQ